MAEGKTALYRQWRLLRLIPRYPIKTIASKLCSRLRDEGILVTKRTVERDLQSLSEIFPLTSDERDKPYGWSWQKNAPSFDIPGLTGPQALTFALVEQYLRPLLPASMLDELKPYFTAAAQRLGSLPRERGIPSWTGKVRVVPPAQALLPPRINLDAQRSVYESLLNNRQAKLVYHKRGADSPVEYIVHPLAVVQRGPVFYLVCTLFHYQDVLLLALHRVLSAVVLDEPSSRPKGFDLDAYIRTGALDFGSGCTIRLEALFTKDAAEHLHETPLSDNQTIKPAGEGQVKVTATVAETPQLTWWLMAFGEQVEVIRPKGLRREIATSAQAMAKLYRT